MAQEIHQSAQLRRHREMDLMGMLIVVGLVFFHGARIVGGTGFYVENTDQGLPARIVADYLLGFGNLWGMPLMMLIAGTAFWYSLRKRTAGQFLLNRVQRLLIPFFTGMVVIFPPVVWFGLKFHEPSYNESYWQFLGRFLDVRFSRWYPTPGTPLLTRSAHRL